MGVLKGFAEAHRHKGGFNKWVYDTLKALTEDASGNSTNDTALATRVAKLEGILSTNISFTVKDDAGEPAAIQGAKVTVDGKTGTTGSSGGCTINGVIYGEYTVNVTATGMTDYTGTITVDATHSSFNITMTTATG